MSLLLKALNKAEGEEKKQIANDRSVAVDFDEIETPQPSDSKAAGNVASTGGSGDVEEKRQRMVAATRVFGAKDKVVVKKRGGNGFILLASLLVIFGGGYFYLESSGIDVGGLVDTSILWGEKDIVPLKASGSSRVTLVAEGILLLPKPSIDVQSEVDFSAFKDSDGEDIEIGTPEFSQKLSIIVSDPYGIRDSLLEDEEDDGVVNEEQSVTNKEELAEPVVFGVVSAEKNRELKARLDSRTPSDSRLDGVVVKKLVAAQKLYDVVDVVDEEADANESTEQKIAEKDVSASASGVERKRMLTRARDLYRNGDYAEAEAVYKNILRDSPTSVDALRGMALLATATRRYQLAVATYLKILDFYPGDPFAVTGLTDLGGDSLDPYEVEKSLKNVLGKNQDLDGRIYFSLGNVYATQQRWKNAQDSYFQAFSHEPKNPDYAYNLAVTLDYLNKQKLALRYYEEAIRLAKHTKISGFSVSAAKARVSVLENK